MEIKISKCNTHCCECKSEFMHEQKVHSQVALQEEKLERYDYCAACHSNAAQSNVFCAWNVRYLDPRVTEAEQQEVFSPLRRLFYDMAALNDRAALAQAYLAAQLLKRQKVFRQIKESDEADGAERVTLFLDRLGGRLIETRDLNFTYSELDEARIQLMEQLRLLESGAPDTNAAAQNDADAVDDKNSAPQQDLFDVVDGNSVVVEPTEPLLEADHAPDEADMPTEDDIAAEIESEAGAVSSTQVNEDVQITA